MTKEALRRLRDDERQSPIGREIIEKMLSGDDVIIQPYVFQVSPAADDDQRHHDHA